MTTTTEELQRDLASFADPGTQVTVVPLASEWYRVTWVEEGEERTAEFLLEDGHPVEVIENDLRMAYAAFLAGPTMGNLRALARNTLQVLEAVENFVHPRGRLEEDPPMDGDALDLLRAAAIPVDGRSSVVFVAADAGVGKTMLLRTAVREQARRYLAGEVTVLWLYVDAQARRLAALDEALASELDRLRAKFSFEGAVPLARSGALVIVVDGFDELVGSFGAYDEAFSGLADLLSDLGGSGTLIAAARSTYYEQEFLRRVSTNASATSSWVVRPLRLREWSDTQRDEYVRAVVARSDEDADLDPEQSARDIAAVLDSAHLGGVANRPFFVARTTELMLEGGLPPASEATGLLGQLVDAYVSREVGKLVTLGNRSNLLSHEAFASLYSEIAIEMWRQESRELTRTTLRELAGLLAESEGAEEDQIREIVTRAPHFAMLRSGTTPGSVAWEHDVYFGYFLSRPLASALKGGDPRAIARLLRRGRLPQEAATLAGALLQEVDAQTLIDLLAESGHQEQVERERVRINAGLLVGGRIANRTNEDLRLHDVVVGDLALGQTTLRRCSFSELTFAGTDLTGTRLENCRQAGGLVFDRVVVDPSSTWLDVDGLDLDAFFGLTTREGESERRVFAPRDIRTILEGCGLPSAFVTPDLRPVDAGVLGILERLATLFTRTNAIVEGASDDDYVQVAVTSDPDWPRVRRALIDSGVVVARKKQSSGQKTFLERTVPAELILSGQDRAIDVPPSIAALWDQLSKL